MKTIQYTIPNIQSIQTDPIIPNQQFHLTSIQIQQLLDLLEPIAIHSPQVDKLLTDIFDNGFPLD